MTGAIEKNKLVYVLNRDSRARLTISSPLEVPMDPAHPAILSPLAEDL